MGNKQTAFSEEQLDAYQVRNAAQKNDVCFNAPLLPWFTGYIYFVRPCCNSAHCRVRICYCIEYNVK